MSNATDTLEATTVTVANPATHKPLDRLDRCDSCGAQAMQLVGIAGGTLTFCNHHFQKHSAALIAQGASVLEDISHTLQTDGLRDAASSV